MKLVIRNHGDKYTVHNLSVIQIYILRIHKSQYELMDLKGLEQLEDCDVFIITL